MGQSSTRGLRGRTTSLGDDVGVDPSGVAVVCVTSPARKPSGMRGTVESLRHPATTDHTRSIKWSRLTDFKNVALTLYYIKKIPVIVY